MARDEGGDVAALGTVFALATAVKLLLIPA
jgi:hypothetical protein